MTDFRPATLHEVHLMLDWAADEGWNPGLDDAAAFHGSDPGGFFVATDTADQPVAAISVVNHTPNFAFLGLYIVRPEHRGQGIGLALWSHAMGHAGQRTIGLDGVEDQQDNYKVSGFSHAGGTTRFTGQIHHKNHSGVSVSSASDKAALISLEARCSGVEKPAYLNAWFTPQDTRVTLVDRTASGIAACCTIRRCKLGTKVGPLVAANKAAARRLLEHAASLFQGPFVIDVPASSPLMTQLCIELSFEPGFRTARMYRGTPPVAKDPLPYFAITSLELG